MRVTHTKSMVTPKENSLVLIPLLSQEKDIALILNTQNGDVLKIIKALGRPIKQKVN